VNLEQELAEAMKRKQPPPGLAGRVMARIDSREAPASATSFWHFHGAGLRLAVAVTLLVMIGVGVVWQRETRLDRQQGEAAARQLMTALQIASEALNDAKRMVGQ
jgi:hypothetical protein